MLDASLLASGMWQIQTDLVNSVITPPEVRARMASFGYDRFQMPNPLMSSYRTRDGRFVSLQMLSPERYWPDLCKAIGQPDMATDAALRRLSDARRENSPRVRRVARRAVRRARPRRVATDPETCSRGSGCPSSIRTSFPTTPQVEANRYIADVDLGDGTTVPMVASPVQFDGQPNRPTRGPEHGEHTEAVLLELDLSWDDIGALKQRGVIL